jgi:hypothetical protein
LQHTSSHTRPWPMGRTGGCNPEHMPPLRALRAAVCRPAKWGGRTALPFSGYPANSHAPAIRGCRSSARGLPAVPNMPGTCPCSLPAVAAHATAASHSNRFAEPKATAILPRKPTGFGRAGAVCLARGAAARPLANRRNPRPLFLSFFLCVEWLISLWSSLDVHVPWTTLLASVSTRRHKAPPRLDVHVSRRRGRVPV